MALLLQPQASGIGWPLFGGILAGTILGLGIGVVEANRGRSPEPGRIDEMQRRLGRWSAGAWAWAIVVGAVPVISYLASSGGVTVFGEVR